MNIQNEIEQLEKQIESLKKKQEEDRAKRRIVEMGDVYHNSNTNSKMIVVCLNRYGNIMWGYIFNDGSGKLFPSKIELEDCLAQDKFKYLTNKLYF